jgi:hypothetical protein
MQQEDISIQQTDHSMVEGNISLKTPSSKLVDFWNTFHLFPSSFEKNAFRRWYILALGPYLTLLFLSCLLDIFWNIRNTGNGFSGFPFSFSFTASELTDWIFISISVVLSLCALAFNRWCQRIVPTLRTLLDEGHILSPAQDDLRQRYFDFLGQYQQSLLSRKRYLLIAFVLILTLLLTGIPFVFPALGRTIFDYFPSFFSFDPIFDLVSFLHNLIWNVLATLVWSYFGAAGGWIILMTSLFLRKMTALFDLNIQPHHPDKSGGLRLLGSFCFSMVLPLLISTIFLGAYSIGVIHFPGSYSYLIPTAARVALLLLALPLTTIAFFVPLWNIHEKMVRRKARYENEFAHRMEEVSKRILTTLDQRMLEEAKTAKEEMEILQVIDPNTFGYPSWPFDTRILIALLLPQIIALVSVAVQIIQLLFH